MQTNNNTEDVMTPRESEAQDVDRVRKAHEFLMDCRNKENEARRALADAHKQVAFAKLRYDTAFTECEKRAYDRRKSGLIEYEPVI
jgi:hypothetical protein